jgi:Dolichyl-phosphate-mannose-protein mannosyltransferase
MATVTQEGLPIGEGPVAQLSRRLSSWLPFLWSRVLFPAKPAPPEPFRLWRLLVLLVVPAALLYGCLSFHLFEPDEGRYAEIPREMLVRGEWIIPYLQGEPYLDKPPLLYWLVNLSYRVFGLHNWAARLIPALAIHLTILCTYLLGRRSLGERAAFAGAALATLAPGLVTIGRLLILDGLLTLWVTLALFSAFEALRTDRLRWSWWLLSALATGLGILTKGPVALCLLVPPLAFYRWLNGCGWRFPRFALAIFALVVLAVALPWYVAIGIRLPDFAYHFFWQHNIVRFLDPFDHLRPIWFYGPVLLAGLVPGSLLVISLIRFLLSGRREDADRRSGELGFALLAGGWCVLFFSLSGCKLPTYVMPAFPPLCLALGSYLVGSSWWQSRWPGLVGIAAFLFICLGHNILLPWYAGYRAPLARIAELKEFCSDPKTPIVCYPRNCDSVSFYVGRDDFQIYRSKETHLLLFFMQQHPRTVLLLTHRHSLDALMHALTPDLEVTSSKRLALRRFSGLSDSLAQNISWLMGETSLGLCDVAVIEHRTVQAARR